MQCRSHVAQLGRLYKEFQAAGAEVLVILGDSPERALKYSQQLKTPFPILSDADRAVYHTYDLEMAFFLQRTASLVIDRAGVIQYIQRATNPLRWLQECHELVDIAAGLEKTR